MTLKELKKRIFKKLDSQKVGYYEGTSGVKFSKKHYFISGIYICDYDLRLNKIVIKDVLKGN